MLINMDSPKDGERQAQRILSFNRYATLELRINKGSKKGAKNIARFRSSVLMAQRIDYAEGAKSPGSMQFEL